MLDLLHETRPSAEPPVNKVPTWPGIFLVLPWSAPGASPACLSVSLAAPRAVSLGPGRTGVEMVLDRCFSATGSRWISLPTLPSAASTRP